MFSNQFMQMAIEEAKSAMEHNEVPIGCVIVDYETKQVIAKAHNKTESLKNCLMHAEIVAITKACSVLNQKILPTCDIYVSVEPCTMCAAAISLVRFRRLYFGSLEPKMGACLSNANFFQTRVCLHKPDIYSGISSEESAKLMQSFFRNKR